MRSVRSTLAVTAVTLALVTAGGAAAFADDSPKTPAATTHQAAETATEAAETAAEEAADAA
ncbi:MAG: hypothetical protein H7231_04245, partial [Rhodoferax sp.]|nr:hypothetical protein [Actinomycetota bacterium]